MDFSRISEDEKINGIKITNVPKYIRDKAYLTDFSETLAQLAEMIIQLGVNLSLDPDEALEWARKLQESVSQSEFDSWVATLLDGGPSIFMNTLSELQSTYPNGTPGVALVRETDPAKIYVWNGTAWEDFGDYQGIEVGDGTITNSKLVPRAVSADKTDFFDTTSKRVEADFEEKERWVPNEGTGGIHFADGRTSYIGKVEVGDYELKAPAQYTRLRIFQYDTYPTFSSPTAISSDQQATRIIHGDADGKPATLEFKITKAGYLVIYFEDKAEFELIYTEQKIPTNLLEIKNVNPSQTDFIEVTERNITGDGTVEIDGVLNLDTRKLHTSVNPGTGQDTTIFKIDKNSTYTIKIPTSLITGGHKRIYVYKNYPTRIDQISTEIASEVLATDGSVNEEIVYTAKEDSYLAVYFGGNTGWEIIETKQVLDSGITVPSSADTDLITKQISQGNKYMYPDYPVWGHEYLWSWYQKLYTDQPVKMVWGGDSTTNSGDRHTLSKRILEKCGYPSELITSINAGHGTQHTGNWLGGDLDEDKWTENGFLDDEMAMDPDLYVIAYGVNDGSSTHFPNLTFDERVARFEANMIDGLERIRGSRYNKKPSDMAIILISPVSTDNTAPVELWQHRINPILKRLAREYNCAYADFTSRQYDHYFNRDWSLNGDGVHPIYLTNVVYMSMLDDLLYPLLLRKN